MVAETWRYFTHYTEPSNFTLSSNHTPTPLTDRYLSLLNSYTSLYTQTLALNNRTFASLDQYNSSVENFESYVQAQNITDLMIKDLAFAVKIDRLIYEYNYVLQDAETRLPQSRMWQALINNARMSAALPEVKRNWTQLTIQDCVNTYNTNFLSKNRNLIIVLYSEDNLNGLKYGMEIATSQGQAQSWIGCPESYYEYRCPELESVISDVRAGSNWTIGTYGVAKECWTEKTDEQCKLQFSAPILFVVIGCNFVKAMCMLLVFLQRDFNPLATIGDAIQSFMREPDPNTSGICYAGRHYIHTQRKFYQRWNTGKPRPLEWVPAKHRWWQAVSLTRWIACISIISAALITTAALLGLAVEADLVFYGNRNIKSMWGRGFGRPNLSSVIDTVRGFDDRSLFAAVLLANTPQLIFSFLYLMYNAVFTGLLMGREWNRYAYFRKPLRVSDPAVGQRSTYWLQVPFQYGIPMMILSGLLHWLISQSIYLVRVQFLPNDEKYIIPLTYNDIDAYSTLSAVGYSSISTVLVIPAGMLMVIAIVTCGFKWYRYDMPLIGSCSAAISAACHPVNSDTRATLRPLMWGDVGTVDGGSTRHLSFSDGDVKAPKEGVLYA